MRENIKSWKASLQGTLNVDKWGGQFLEKLFKYAILPTLKKILKLLGPPSHQRISAPVKISYKQLTNESIYTETKLDMPPK